MAARWAAAAALLLGWQGASLAQQAEITRCNLAPFQPTGLPLSQIAIVATSRAGDPNYQLSALKAQCVQQDEQVLDVCGTVSRMNAAGYVDRVISFSGRFDFRGGQTKPVGVRFGPASKALCDRVLEPTPFAKSLLGQ